MIQILYIFSLLIISTSPYDWEVVKQVINQYHLNGAFPGAVLRIAN